MHFPRAELNPYQKREQTLEKHQVSTGPCIPANFTFEALTLVMAGRFQVTA